MNGKEALAMIWAIRKYESYLYGKEFTLTTNHEPTTFMKTSERNTRILRKRLELVNFDYDISCKQDIQNEQQHKRNKNKMKKIQK